MNVILRSLIAGALVARAATGQSPSEDAMRLVARRIVDLETRRQLANATPATVDSLLALYSDSVVYEHPNARAVIRGKEAMRHGMVQYIGSIRSVRSEPPRITVGNGVAFVETRAHMEIEDKGKWVPVSRRGLRVIEFDSAGRVRRLIDYPW